MSRKLWYNLLFILPLLLAGNLIGCGDGSSLNTSSGTRQEKIINGVPVLETDAPQILQLRIYGADGSMALCSGTAIGAEAVLSAAHCFVSTAIARVEVLGSGRVVQATSVNVHPGYVAQVGALFNDAAIVHTGTPHGFPRLGLINSVVPQAGESIGIWGSGFDEAGQYGQLKHGEMILDAVTPNHLMSVFDDAQNTCNGDSGGPATYTLLDADGNVIAVGLVGITSSGSIEECTQGDLSLFTNLQNPTVLSFIQTQVPDAVIY